MAVTAFFRDTAHHVALEQHFRVGVGGSVQQAADVVAVRLFTAVGADELRQAAQVIQFIQ